MPSLLAAVEHERRSIGEAQEGPALKSGGEDRVCRTNVDGIASGEKAWSSRCDLADDAARAWSKRGIHAEGVRLATLTGRKEGV